jgi:hypothetical protein
MKAEGNRKDVVRSAARRGATFLFRRERPGTMLSIQTWPRSEGHVVGLAPQVGSLGRGTLLRSSVRPTQAGRIPKETVQTHPHMVQGVYRRTVLKAALAAGVTLSTWSLPVSPGL